MEGRVDGDLEMASLARVFNVGLREAHYDLIMLVLLRKAQKLESLP